MPSAMTFIVANKLIIIAAAVILASGTIATVYLLQPHTTTTTTTIINGTTTTTITTTTIQTFATNTPIKHIIIIFQENHAFDNYFGTYPNATGINFSVCEPINLADPSRGCVHPWLNTNAVDTGAGHSWQNSHVAYDNGSMNGFITAAGGKINVMSYYNNQTIPDYWFMAEHYNLFDHLYSSVLSYSQPNHWYEIAGQAPNVSLYNGYCGAAGPKTPSKNGEFCASPAGNATPGVQPIGWTYLQEANNITTMADLLESKNISWSYYGATKIEPTYQQEITNGGAFAYWTPLLSQARSFNQSRFGDNKYTGQIFSDIADHNLPNISWVSPPASLSDHPPANITVGSWYVSDIVDSVMNSSYWNSTVIIIMEDDFGGYYDGVNPPILDTNVNGTIGLSFRVPGIIISAYPAKNGAVDHNTESFESTLKLIDTLYGFKNWNARVNSSVIGDMMESFNFNQSPQKPYTIPLTQAQKNMVASDLSKFGLAQSNNLTDNETGALLYEGPIDPFYNYSQLNFTFMNSTAGQQNLTNESNYDIVVNNYVIPASWFDT